MTVVRSLNATALHARTADLCATNAWVEDNGFTVPASYSSAREEQWALQERAAISDISTRQVWSFCGPDAGSFLSFATINDATALAPGRAQETYWCDDHGFVRGKGTLVRRGATEFELMTQIRDLAWMFDGADGFDLEIHDVTNERAAVGIAGPLAPALLSEAALLTLDMHSGDVADVQWRATRLSVIRLEGDAGYELLTASEDAIVVWDRLWRAGRPMGLSVAGADALDLARIEAGRLKPGIDWLPAQSALSDGDLRVPQDFSVSLGLTRRFNGVDALGRVALGGRVVPVQVVADGRLVAGTLSTKTAVGHLTSAARSEARDESVALGWAEPAVVKAGATLTATGPAGPVEARITMPAAKSG